jgi:hypothetical protein
MIGKLLFKFMQDQSSQANVKAISMEDNFIFEKPVLLSQTGHFLNTRHLLPYYLY